MNLSPSCPGSPTTLIATRTTAPERQHSGAVEDDCMACSNDLRGGLPPSESIEVTEHWRVALAHNEEMDGLR